MNADVNRHVNHRRNCPKSKVVVGDIRFWTIPSVIDMPVYVGIHL